MPTAHFSPDFLAFFQELSKNNNRDWFNENKKRFKTNVEQPFKDFVSAMIDQLQPVIAGLDQIEAKDCVFRIYRDVRFSADKSPYKTHMSALIGPGGRKDKTHPGMYLQISAEDARMYSGAHMLEKDQLSAIRNAIINDLSGFKKARNNKTFISTFGEIHGEKNKRLNSPFVEVADQEPLLFNKSFYYFKKWNPDEILKDEFPNTLITTYQAAKPVNDFLFAALR
jgi:uncharacterized protein (TIGR02453 family)